jgi:hypothetical protein
MSRTMHTYIAALVIAASVLCFGGNKTLAAACDAPTPDLTISAPPASVSPDAAAFSGVWAGTWLLRGRGSGNRIHQCARIHVSVSDNHNAAVAYCYGSRPDRGTNAQCDRYSAMIQGNRLRFVTSIGVHIALHRRGPGRAEGTMQFPAGLRTNFADFHRL